MPKEVLSGLFFVERGWLNAFAELILVTGAGHTRQTREALLRGFLFHVMVRPAGVEPAHLAPEASALSTELRAQCKIGRAHVGTPVTT